MTDQRMVPRKAFSPLSLRHLVPSGWHEEGPAFAGDPFFDWESKPEPPRAQRELYPVESHHPQRKS